jgi:iron complex outermembrane receptor protein
MHLQNFQLLVVKMNLIAPLRCHPSLVVGFAACMAVLGNPVSAVAQESNNVEYMEEVVVTAQKKEQKLQDVGISVTVFSGETIEKLGLRQSTDVASQTPNFSVGYPNGENGVPSSFIRGVGLNDFGVTNSGPIATYVDDVYVASNAAQIFQLLDIERVEVLRGPQGTLYGRNATGGAINYIARKPGDQMEGIAKISIGTYNTSKIEVAYGGPVSEKLGFRGAIVKNDSDGWLENQVTGNDLNGTDDIAYRFLFDYQKSEDFNVLLNLHGGETNSDSTVYGHRGVLDPDTLEPCMPARIARSECVDFLGYRDVGAYDEGSYDFEVENDTTFWGASIRADWDVRGTIFTSITAFDEIDDSRPEETDASPNDVLTVQLAVEQQSVSQELRISREHDSVSWQVGFFYLKDDAQDNSSFDLFRVLRPLVESVDPDAYPNGFSPGGFWSGVDEDGAPNGPPVFETSQATNQHIKSKAIYADLTWDINEQWDMSAGIRYTEEEISQRNSQGFVESGNYIPLMDQRNRDDFNDVSGRIVVNYHPDADTMYYGSISTGFKAGGINNPLLEPATPYDEENLFSYEAGIKSTYRDGKLRLNAAAFYYDYSDLQVFRTVNAGGVVSNILSNAADAEILGAEIELQMLPTDSLFISLALGLLDTEYKSFVIQGADPVTGETTWEVLSGNEITMAPEVSFSGMLLYDIPLSSYGAVQMQLDFSYQDDVFFNSANDPLFTQDSYWLWNARAAWTSPQDSFEIAIWGRNLGDEEYLSYAFDLSELGFHELMLGTPRVVGIEFIYRR